MFHLDDIRMVLLVQQFSFLFEALDDFVGVLLRFDDFDSNNFVGRFEQSLEYLTKAAFANFVVELVQLIFVVVNVLGFELSIQVVKYSVENFPFFISVGVKFD